MTKILLLEDDENIAFGIRTALGRKGFEVICCPDIGQGKQTFTSEFHLVLLDLNLPDGNGYDFCRWVKQQGDIPLIFLTVKDDAADITRGLDMGADDYITKPFHIAVLESRIHAVLRRVSREGRESLSGAGKEPGAGRIQTGKPKTEELLTCGDLRLDTEKIQAFVGECPVTLTGLEYRLLRILMENKGRTLTRSLILEKLWDAQGNFVNDNTLTVAVKRLREKLHQTPCIMTMRGIGYRMEEKE